MPGSVSSRNSAARAFRSSPPAQRVANRGLSWFEPNQSGSAPAGSSAQRLLDDRAQRVELEWGHAELEVLREVEPLPVRRQLVERDVRLAHQRRLGVVLAGDLLPARIDLVHLGPAVHELAAVPQLAILDQGVRDVDPEAGDAAVEPEAEDPFELGADLVVPPVEIGLLDRELVEVVALAAGVVLPRRLAGEDRPPVVRDRVRPDVVLGTIGEPRVAVRGVVRNQIQPGLDPPALRLGDQAVEVGERAELGVDVEVVGDVVAPVDVRRRERRAHPQAVDPEPGEVIESGREAGEVADPVTV